MLGRREDQVPKRVAHSSSSSAAAAAAAGDAALTITTTSGHVMTISEFISRFDESARARLNSMNEKLRGLEMQMETLEAEMSRASRDSSMW